LLYYSTTSKNEKGKGEEKEKKLQSRQLPEGEVGGTHPVVHGIETVEKNQNGKRERRVRRPCRGTKNKLRKDDDVLGNREKETEGSPSWPWG